ncbi:unnamed protein product [Thelazia callipaeda]|uniref:Janus/Ocnus n=1 Tax=Thelazia callipaeda TaxID=103827 RepID=A0A0N5CR84_THECL|nr:unnamed protein product [Thelazia callipaeda]
MIFQVTEKSTKTDKMIVRGYARCDYHGDILFESENELGKNFGLECVGGGRIKHDAKNSSILVYGYSQPNYPVVRVTLDMSLDDIPDVNIDPSGVFKYIVVRVTSKSTSKEKLIVRGFTSCKWHKNILQLTEKEIGNSFSLKCVGGGRIRHESEKRKLFVYGYSQRYGPAKHELTVSLLKKRYPDYDITFSYEGY